MGETAYKRAIGGGDWTKASDRMIEHWERTRSGKVPLTAVVATVDERRTLPGSSARERVRQLIMQAIAADEVSAERHTNSPSQPSRSITSAGCSAGSAASHSCAGSPSRMIFSLNSESAASTS